MYYLRRLRDLRQDHDLTQKEIAGLLDIDQRVYSTYETGKREIPLRHLVALAKYYNKTVEDIFFGQEAYDTYAKRNPEEK